LARLSAAARDAAEAAAVCGPEIDPRLVEKLCPGAAPGLNECVRAGLLVECDDVVGFRHELIRLAILDQVPGHVRRQLYERAVAASAETRDPAPTYVDEPTGSYTEPENAARDHGHRAATRADPDHLTRREREILELLAVGHSDAQIAGRLFISQRTVNNHVHAILHKLGVHNRTQAASITRQRPTDTGRVR
jgi:DNA-binding CsgD family transcriptional regulator